MADTEALCFSEYIQDFQEKEFQVEEFISKCRKKVTVECLRRDLDIYYRTLKSAMVELINKDYADFVNLSANLVGMDRSINELITPLSQLQEEILSIRDSMESAIQATEAKLTQRAQIIKDKDTLQRLLCILDSLDKLERLLKVRHSPQDSKDEKGERDPSEIEHLAEKPEFASLVMERIASEFNKLQYNVRLAEEHPLVENNKSRIAVITSMLQSKLEDSFRHGLKTGDKRTLTQSLQTYASIGRFQAAEAFFQVYIVHPYMDKVISSKSLLSHPSGLSGLYADILKFIPECCSPLLESVSGADQQHRPLKMKGFDFLVNSVWPEVVSLIERKMSVIFAPGNPDSFHKNYTSSMEFVSSFERQCHSPSSIKALRSHPSFNGFMSKWSLPVYFQIRFQDIAGCLETSLGLPLVAFEPGSCDPSSHIPQYHLTLFDMLEQCILKCWSDGIFIPTLAHRFWKLTLQLLLRVSVMLDELATSSIQQVEIKRPHQSKTLSSHEEGSNSNSLPLPTSLKIIHDCELLHSKIDMIFSTSIKPKLHHIKDEALYKECLTEASSKIVLLVPEFSSLVVQEVTFQSIRGLESANTLPRLYRRTNRENIGDFPARYKLDWSDRVISELTKRYFEISSELLTSVQRTEESLLKLKSYRKSLAPPTSSSPGAMTDDNKIRLQLAIDIEHFSLQILTVHSSAVHLPDFKKLLEMGQTAKTTALSTQARPLHEIT